MGNYTRLERLLHWLMLGVPAAAEMAFDIDQAITRPDHAAAAQGRHVFVAGLARAGTTILTRRLFGTGAFVSLTYRDMPFVLAPNIWQRLRRGRERSLAKSERAHGDGVVVDVDSPESLDEPFWRIFDDRSYIRPDHLASHVPDCRTLERYQSLVAAILHAGRGERYLCKNNNNVLRLPALAKAFPNAEILIPFREPVAQALSLLSQHGRFIRTHEEDPFARTYMGWLGHHEFGSDYRPFWRPAGTTYGADCLDFWIARWCETYEWLLENAPPRARFVCYEDLCSTPELWRKLSALLALPDSPDGEIFRAARPAVSHAAAGKHARAQASYDSLRRRSEQDLNRAGPLISQATSQIGRCISPMLRPS